MYIKQVIIEGFKSYRERIVLESFDKRHNVVVGRNGSGKSNFINAILFILSDEFSHLSLEQRLDLLHKGTDQRVTSAFVEIIFDNSDNKIPIEEDEIVLRRVIGSQRDEFFLNKKAVPRAEVLNLLESAGLSNPKPHYIIKQGEINLMAIKLLEEVVGTRYYDERREVSVNKLKETDRKLERINDFLQTIEERLKLLAKQKEDLKECQKLDRARRIIKFIIYNTEHKENMRKSQEVKRAREKMEEDVKGPEKMTSKEVIQESLDKIRALGTLSHTSDLYAKYQNMSIKQLFKELEKVHQHLKKYRVNNKALKQFDSSFEQREKLYHRKEELVKYGEKIRVEMESLEYQKLVAVHSAFIQMNKNFTEVFKKLVPQGRGNLVIRAVEGEVDQFSGVGIRVSFTSGEGHMGEVSRFSGSQKSLVALALIFAIHKCYPAPFYLFDEIDQGLDAQHREAIADMIHEMSSSAQIITTTFRPELFESAHKIYGVKFDNKVSHIECVTRDEAKDFAEDSATQA